MKTNQTAVPFKWPFPPSSKARPSGAPVKGKPPAAQPAGISSAASVRKSMLADVVMVVVWAASIPGLMWLGAAGGF